MGRTLLKLSLNDWIYFLEVTKMIVIGAALFLCGLVMLISPGTVYQFTESWKNNRDGEPSDLYKLTTRIEGGILLIVGIVLLVMRFSG